MLDTTTNTGLIHLNWGYGIPPATNTVRTNLALLRGEPLLLSVATNGTPPPTFQWFYEQTPLAGRTNSTLFISNVQKTNEGLYSVRLSNSVGAVTVDICFLTLQTPPEILTHPHPTSQTVIENQTATFEISATGDAPLVYQWHDTHGPINGAVSNVLSRAAGVTNAGNYWVLVTNQYGAATSLVATLSVAPAVNILPKNPQAPGCAPMTFSVLPTNNILTNYIWRLVQETNELRRAAGNIFTLEPGALCEEGSYTIQVIPQYSFVIQPQTNATDLTVAKPSDVQLASLSLKQGELRFRLCSPWVGRSHQIKTSTNLTDWEVLAVFTNTTWGCVDFTNHLEGPQRFFRVLVERSNP